MATWMDHEHFSSQLGNGDGHFAPNPAEYPVKTTIQERGASFWISEYPISLDDVWKDAAIPSEEVDVVIIGSGITGAAAAYHFSTSRPELQIALLDARGICTGATGRNGGHMCAPEVTHIRELSEKIGSQEAVMCRSLPLRNRDMVLAAVEKLDIADQVDLRMDGTITIFGSEAERESFKKDVAFAKDHGMKPEAVLLSPEEVMQKVDVPEPIARFGAAFLEKSGTIYPRKLVDALLRHATQNMPHLTIHPFTPVSSVTHDPSVKMVSVSTDKGIIRTRSVLHATNGWASHLTPEVRGKNGVHPCLAHVLAVRPDVKGCAQLRPGFGYAQFWHWMFQRHDSGPFIYGFSDAEVMNDYDDSKTIARDNIALKHMLSFLQTAFPKSFQSPDYERDVLYDWTGVQGLTKSGASYVGRPSTEKPGEFMSVGHNGEGMTRCFACASVATDAIIAYLDEREYSPPSWLPLCYRYNI